MARSMDASEHAAVAGSAVELDTRTDDEKEHGEPGEKDIGCQPDKESSRDRLDPYRYLLLLHCFTEGVAGSSGKPSACVQYVLNRHGVTGEMDQILSHSDLNVMSRVMEYRRD